MTMHLRRLLLLIGLCLIAVATAGCKKARLRSQLKELMGSTIVLPEKISCVRDGEMYPMPDSVRQKAKLLVYVDSTECSKCRISRFVRYEPFFKESERDGKFEVVLLLSIKASEYAETVEYLELLENPFPVYIDEEHAFLGRNPVLPADSRLHGMFLQADGRPVLFGDPAAGEKIEELYFKVL